MSQSRRKKKKISPIENHSERHEIIERCFHIHRMEIEIGSAIPATNFNNRRLWFARLLFDRVSASSPTYSWCQLRIIFVLKATTGSLSIAWPSRARHSINVESRRANAVLRKSTTHVSSPPPNFGKRNRPPPRENPPPDPSWIISRVENLENLFEHSIGISSIVLSLFPVFEFRMNWISRMYSILIPFRLLLFSIIRYIYLGNKGTVLFLHDYNRMLVLHE